MQLIFQYLLTNRVSLVVVVLHNQVYGLANHLFDIFVSSTTTCNEHSALAPCLDTDSKNISYVQLVAQVAPYKVMLVRLKQKAGKIR